MARETQLTITGNLTTDPELRYTQNGAAVAAFTIASTPSTFNRQTNQWEDGNALFMRCSAWNEFAENISESLRKGMRVIAQGSLVQRSYENREGQTRTIIELRVEEIGPSLRFSRAQVTKTSQAQQQMSPNTQTAYQIQDQTNATASASWSYPAGGQADDPWRQQSQQGQQAGFDYGNPPF